MIVKWVVGFLLVLNAGLFLWATGFESEGSDPAAAYPVVSAEGMRLLSEVKAGNESSADSGRRCLRIGPFEDSAVASLVAQKLDAMALEYSRLTVKSREIRAFRVFLGPFESPSAIQAQRQLLDAEGIEDYYVKQDDPGAGIISLGLFSQREGAEALQRRLARDNIQSRLRAEDRVLEPNFWLEIDDPAVAGDVPPELHEAKWGEKEAKIRRYDCP